MDHYQLELRSVLPHLAFHLCPLDPPLHAPSDKTTRDGPDSSSVHALGIYLVRDRNGPSTRSGGSCAHRRSMVLMVDYVNSNNFQPLLPIHNPVSPIVIKSEELHLGAL